MLPDASKMPRDGPRCFKMAEDAPKMLTIPPKTPPRQPKMPPRRPEDAPSRNRDAPRRSRMSQGAPGWGRNGDQAGAECTKRDQVRHKWVPAGTRWSPDGTRWGLEAKALVFKSGFRRELGVQKGPATPSSPTHPPPSPPQDAPRHHLRRPTPAPEDGPGRAQAHPRRTRTPQDGPRRARAPQVGCQVGTTWGAFGRRS